MQFRNPAYNWFAGVLLAAILGAAATLLAGTPQFATRGIGALTIALLLGVCAGNVLAGTVTPFSNGIAFSRQTLLRVGIVLYGLRITFQSVAAVGMPALVTDVLMIISTFAIAAVAGRRMFGLDRPTVALIATGSAVCGAAAVLAAAPVVRGRPQHVTVAVSTVVTFGTIAMLLYPAIYPLFAHAFGLSTVRYGVYIGSTVHEVAQVVAAARSFGEAATDTAVITKMARVMMLAPVLMVLSLREPRPAPGEADAAGSDTAPPVSPGIHLPWFAVGFIAVTALHSLWSLPPRLALVAPSVDDFILAMAMAALGLTTRVATLLKTGARAFLLAALLFVWLVAGGMIVNLAVWELAAWSVR